MKKSDLRTGHIVTMRNGSRLVVFRNCMYHNAKDVLVSKCGDWFRLSDFNEDMTFNSENTILKNTKMWDIMKVETTNHPSNLVGGDCSGKVIWERKETKKMTISEIEAILGYKIEVVSEK